MIRCFPRERARTGSELVARRTEARPFLPHWEWGGRKGAPERVCTSRKGGRQGKEEGRRGAHLALARSGCLGPPCREKHSPEHFQNAAHEVKQGAGIAAGGPPRRARKQRDAGEWKADAVQVLQYCMLLLAKMSRIICVTSLEEAETFLLKDE